MKLGSLKVRPKGDVAPRRPTNPTRRKTEERAAQDLLRRSRQLKERMASFEGTAQEILLWLDPQVSAEKNEAMISPAANILGTLEGLLADDLEPAFRKLVELDSHLTTAGSFANLEPE